MSGSMLPPLVEPGPPLTPEETARYARHLTLPEVGIEGQRRLRNARVLVIGAGGLGSPVLLYLAAAGVGIIGVVDDDHVELSNLHRQVLHGVDDLGRAKVDSARDAVAALDPAVTVRTHPVRLTSDNVLDLFAQYDLVVDGADNFATRYLVADAGEITRTPVVWGSILRFDGQVSTFWPGHGPLYRDLFPLPPAPGEVPSCAQAGVLGALCGSVGSAMAAEVVRLVTGAGRSFVGRLMVHDALRGTWEEIPVRPDPRRAPVTELGNDESSCDVATPRPAPTDEVGPNELAGLVVDSTSAVTVVDVREQSEFATLRLPTARLLPLDRLLADPELLPEGPVVLHCQSGVRSARALTAVQAHGRHDVRHLAGGIQAWLLAGLPVESDSREERQDDGDVR